MKNKNKLLILPLLVVMLVVVAFRNESPDNAVPETYEKFCAQCHGADLQGGNAQSLIDGIWQFGTGDSHMFRNIKYGIPHLGMPSFEASLSDEQIKELVDFLQDQETVAGVKKPEIPDSLETLEYKMNVEKYAENLEIPWAIDFIDANTALITERPGRLRIVRNGKLEKKAISGTPEVLHEGQGGLMDVAVDPDYANNGWIYLAYSHVLPKQPNSSEPAPAMTRLVRGRLKNNSWVDQQVIFEAPHELYRTTRHHYGSRIVFDPEGHLYFAIGDRGAQDQAQDITRPNGKVHRIYTDGKIPPDNPFYGRENAIASIYSLGNRNAQGLAVHPQTGLLWETEHGPFGGDELNLIRPGVNYGWPVITYGRNYNGTPVTDIVKKEGMAQPNYFWKPSIAVCGLDFYQGDLFPLWKNHLLVGALKYEEVQLLNIEDDRVIHSQTIVKNLGRVRDVAAGPDGAIYVVLNDPGTVIRLTPK